ncbi:hypothetical protein [Calothrix sp. 336/3]|nr:hypothetical protein [Calothrix sp. 336/3]
MTGDRKDYQQALQIKIEFGDRYSQAGTKLLYSLQLDAIALWHSL